MPRALLVLLLLGPAIARADTGAQDEPGVHHKADEPALVLVEAPAPGRSRFHEHVRLELGFGYSSLLEDPEVGEGYGGGLYLTWEFYRRLGVEVSAFVANNPYVGDLGDIGATFLAGNITLGPTLRLTPAGSRLSVNADLGVGTYVIVQMLQDKSWSLGLSGGLSVALRLASWFGVTLKLRYHLFNLTTIAGPELRDLKALQKMGVVDRFEIPLCLSFFICG